MTDVKLDTIAGCIAELTACNQEVATFAHDWAEKAGRLKMLEKREQRLHTAAMRGTTGKNADERAATAAVAVEAHPLGEGIYEEIENLIGEVEAYKRKFEVVDRRSSNTQSILSLHRQSHRFEDFTPMGPKAVA